MFHSVSSLAREKGSLCPVLQKVLYVLWSQLVCNTFYFVMPSYWCPRPPRPVEAKEEGKEGLLDPNTQFLDPNYEAVESSLAFQSSQNRTVNIRNLRKEFDHKPAVDGLNVDMYSGQIFALLGHNGAGKTTTISMLTGMLYPTDGQANAFGIDVFNNFVNLRKDLGVCTQHDSLFDQLTVYEHLTLFGKIRGITDEEISVQSKKLLTDLNLKFERDTLAKNLSGGNKRKLSVALAFIGNPRFVLLDEPTSGMDATTRRELWDILASYKKDRILLLTTHYMDEADTLGDRIGIMSEGKLICCGSSMFLKKRYGIGYNLGIIMNDTSVSSENIKNFVTDRINGVELGLVAGEELELRLPFSESSKFNNLFTEIDSNMDNLGIKSYGISITTLEDVFIKVGENCGIVEKDWKMKEKLRKSEIRESADGNHSIAEDFERSKCEQFGAIFLKKIRESKRNISVIIFSIILPLLLMWSGLITLKSIFNAREHTYSLAKDFYQTPIFVNNKTFDYNNQKHKDWISKYGQESKAVFNYINISRNETIMPVIEEFAEQLDFFRNRDPYIYGSYYIHTFEEVDNKNSYAVIHFFNLTTPQSILAFSGEFIKMLVKSYKPSASMETTITQMQVADPIKDLIYKMQQVGQFVSLFSMGLGLIPGLIASYLLHEYEAELKAHLLLAGLPLWIYWTAYGLIDLINLYIPISGVILMYKLMEIAVSFI